jgi:hypothetical protein
MKNVYKNKNKILGVCAFLFAFVAFTPLISNAQGDFTYSRDPAGEGSYESVSLSFSTPDFELLDFYDLATTSKPWDPTWDTCAIGDLNSGTPSFMFNNTFSPVDSQTFSDTWTYDNLGLASDQTGVIQVRLKCWANANESNYGFVTLEIRMMPGDPLFYVIQTQRENFFVATMFPDGSDSNLLENIRDFFSDSGAVPVVLVLMAIILGFLILDEVLKVIGHTTKEKVRRKSKKE